MEKGGIWKMEIDEGEEIFEGKYSEIMKVVNS